MATFSEKLPHLLNATGLSFRILRRKDGGWSSAIALASWVCGHPKIDRLLLSKYIRKCIDPIPYNRNTIYAATKATPHVWSIFSLALLGCKRVDPLRAKKLHVLAALEVERHRKRTLGGVNMSRQVGSTVHGLWCVAVQHCSFPTQTVQYTPRLRFCFMESVETRQAGSYREHHLRIFSFQMHPSWNNNVRLKLNLRFL